MKKKTIISIFFISSVILTIMFSFSNKKENKNTKDETKIIFINGENKNIINTIYKTTYLYNQDILCLYDLPIRNIYTSEIDIDLTKSFRKENFIIQGVHETKHKAMYSSISSYHSMINNYEYFYTSLIDCYVSNNTRLKDNKSYKFIYIISKFDFSYHNHNSYNHLASVFNNIKKKYNNDDLIILGNFNVYYYEKVFFDFFKEEDFTYLKNDNIGLFVSKKIYKSINYKFEKSIFNKNDNIFILTLNNEEENIKDLTTDEIKKTISKNSLFKKTDNDLNIYNLNEVFYTDVFNLKNFNEDENYEIDNYYIYGMNYLFTKLDETFIDTFLSDPEIFSYEGKILKRIEVNNHTNIY